MKRRDDMTLKEFANPDQKTQRTIYFEFLDNGNLSKFTQLLKIKYLDGFQNVTPKVAISLITSNPDDAIERSFRTDSPYILEKIIKALIQCHYRLKDDVPEMKVDD
jgi:hypothetical protein